MVTTAITKTATTVTKNMNFFIVGILPPVYRLCVDRKRYDDGAQTSANKSRRVVIRELGLACLSSQFESADHREQVSHHLACASSSKKAGQPSNPQEYCTFMVGCIQLLAYARKRVVVDVRQTMRASLVFRRSLGVANIFDLWLDQTVCNAKTVPRTAMKPHSVAKASCVCRFRDDKCASLIH